MTTANFGAQMINLRRLSRALGDTALRKNALPAQNDLAAPTDQPSYAILEKLVALDKQMNQLLNEVEFMRRRTNAYLGEGSALAYLSDQAPIFLDPRDSGPAANILNGGLYEIDNIQVLLSFVRPDSVFLDIGANVGIFCLKVGKLVQPAGKVYAFEPQQHLTDLLRRSGFLNGLSTLEGTGTIESYSIGVSDLNGEAGFTIPPGHLGGGFVDPNAVQKVKVTRLDDFFPESFRCDLVKIDIEGHELPALMGMRRILSESPRVKIMFEKLGHEVGCEREIEDCFLEMGFSLYYISTRSQLVPLRYGQLGKCQGTFLAVRPIDPDLEELDRRRLFIYPVQLNLRSASIVDGALKSNRVTTDIVFHGPYWFLPRGQYRIRLHGDLDGKLDITIASRFGYPMASCSFAHGAMESDFTIERDAVHFECVGRLTGSNSRLVLRKIEIVDL
jgi:FkbM family methyltransferase